MSYASSLRQIRHSVPTDTFQTLVVSLVLTRLVYGSGVLAGLPSRQHTTKLQSMRNLKGHITIYRQH